MGGEVTVGVVGIEGMGVVVGEVKEVVVVVVVKMRKEK
jgi:hypothetical protein